MYWYGGSIAEAVTLSKQKNAIFVVFVEGDNDLSTEMAVTIDDSAVVTRLSNQQHFLAVKLKSGSPNYTHFAQIYQFVPVPSLFFIGRNGTPLEVVCAGVQASNLATRIDRILEEHLKDKQSSPTTEPAPTVQAPPTAQPSTSAQNIRDQTINFIRSETATPPKPEEKKEDTGSPPAKIAKTELPQEKPADVVCVGDVCMRVGSKPDEAGPSQPRTPSPVHTPATDTPTEPKLPATDSLGSMEEKMERAKELIEARRREKADKEKELEKEKEMERRAAGKDVAELKRWQADQELKQIQEERRREKMENNLARQRILEQIAQDRAERRARDAPAPAQPLAAQPATSGDGGGKARIQFKLPDGTSHTAHFDADGTLGDVQRYVADNLQLSTSQFSLWTAFPRRELTEAEASLRGLQLAPSAALLVLPRRAAPVLARPTAFTSIITFFTQLFTSMILEPSQQLYAWLRLRLFPPPANPRAVTPTSPPAPSGLGGLRRRGNIHRLPTDRTPDDDNNTWNGNSTQQM